MGETGVLNIYPEKLEIPVGQIANKLHYTNYNNIKTSGKVNAKNKSYLLS